MNTLIKKNIEIDRAISEFRSGRPIIINKDNQYWLFFNLESLDAKLIKRLIKQKNKIYTYITNKKAKNLKLKNINHKKNVHTLFKFNDLKWLQYVHTHKLRDFEYNKFNKNYFSISPSFIEDIFKLAKNSKTIPCLIGCKVNIKSIESSILVFNHKYLKNQNKTIVESTKMVSKSSIPLDKEHKSKIRVFKSFVGGLEHVVLQIGAPNKKEIVNLRIQSSCLTGEVFHSIKCDCYDQLHQSINYISKNGGGYIIHLQQEGRGIGLKNKIIAYNMQDQNLDSYEADAVLGFSGEERDFRIAVKILKFLKIKRVNLITNNKQKINSLKKNGIKVSKRTSTYTTINKFNSNYLLSKNKRKYQYGIK